VEEAIQTTAAQTTSQDLKLFAAAVIIQMRSGGSLADTIQRLADVTRDRMRLIRRARALTAQTQFSKRVLLSIPFLTALLLHYLSPDYLRPLYETPQGRTALAAAGLMLLVGAWIMNRMASLKY